MVQLLEMKTDFAKKEFAIKLRLKGKSIRDIEKTLGAPRSTLSGWLHNVELTKKQKDRLYKNWLEGLIDARKKAALIHKKQKQSRIEIIKQEVKKFISETSLDKKTGELIMATFYLAEGTKKEGSFVIANSNQKTLQGFINLLRYLYKIDESKFRCCLHLRKDQQEKQLKNYWSTLLSIPKSQFIKTQFDKRTIEQTYDTYKGVCVVFYHDIKLQRRILYIGEKKLNVINKL